MIFFFVVGIGCCCFVSIYKSYFCCFRFVSGIYFLSVASGDGQAISVGSVQDRYVHLV